MRKFTKYISAVLAAATLAGGFAVATDASAQSWRYHGGRHYDRHDRTGAAIAAGVAGLALGAALSDRGRGGYYAYGPSYSYGYGYGPGRPYYYSDRYYEPRGYYYSRPRPCTYWERDRWGRPFRVRGWC